MKLAYLSLSLLILCSLNGCSGNRDGLILVDGNGVKYKLEHSIGDLYFVHDLSVYPPSNYSKEDIDANDKLNSRNMGINNNNNINGEEN